MAKKSAQTLSNIEREKIFAQIPGYITEQLHILSKNMFHPRLKDANFSKKHTFLSMTKLGQFFLSCIQETLEIFVSSGLIANSSQKSPVSSPPGGRVSLRRGHTTLYVSV